MNRITPEHINNTIVACQYRVMATTTICLLTLRNGFTVLGESACVDPANFDEEIGRKIAFENAREKIWVLEGYLLKERMYEANPNYPEAK